MAAEEADNVIGQIGTAAALLFGEAATARLHHHKTWAFNDQGTTYEKRVIRLFFEHRRQLRLLLKTILPVGVTS